MSRSIFSMVPVTKESPFPFEPFVAMLKDWLAVLVKETDTQEGNGGRRESNGNSMESLGRMEK